MKKGILFLAIIFINFVIYGQEKSNLYVNFGMKYTPLEYMGGPLIGISAGKPNGKFMWNFRKDIILKISKLNLNNTSNLNYNLTDYNTYNYLDVDYKITEKFYATAGFSWISRQITYNSLSNSPQPVYFAATVAVKYKIDWLTLELRGDIPLEKNISNLIDQGHIFPVSLALYYRFRPKND